MLILKRINSIVGVKNWSSFSSLNFFIAVFRMLINFNLKKLIKNHARPFFSSFISLYCIFFLFLKDVIILKDVATYFFGGLILCKLPLTFFIYLYTSCYYITLYAFMLQNVFIPDFQVTIINLFSQLNFVCDTTGYLSFIYFFNLWWIFFLSIYLYLIRVQNLIFAGHDFFFFFDVLSSRKKCNAGKNFCVELSLLFFFYFSFS